MQNDLNNFKYIDHTADAKFIAYGQTIEEAFENAALAMMNVMIKTDTISDNIIHEVILQSPNLDDLLFDWLSEFLFLMDAENLIFGKFKVINIQQKSENFNLIANIYGECIDHSKHFFDTEVKAATYNEMLIHKVENGWILQVTVDT